MVRVCGRLAAILITCLCGGGSLAWAQRRPQHALMASRDGVYAVEVFTTRGACASVYHWTIKVARGRVSSPADALMQASGQISARGVISLAFRRDQQVANVTGSILGETATGTWSSPTLQCAGSWTAIRR
jgi:hypothetical protein